MDDVGNCGSASQDVSSGVVQTRLSCDHGVIASRLSCNHGVIEGSPCWRPFPYRWKPGGSATGFYLWYRTIMLYNTLSWLVMIKYTHMRLLYYSAPCLINCCTFMSEPHLMFLYYSNILDI